MITRQQLFVLQKHMFKGKQSARSRRYKSFDRHRFQKVFVWIIPIIISVSVGVALVSKAEVFRWSVIASVILLLGYLLFLLEWYVWRENPARKRGRVGFLSLCLLVVVCGNLFQFWIPKSPALFLFGERPYLTALAKLRKPQAGERAVVGITVHNRGEVPARPLRLNGKLLVKEHCPPNSCAPIVLADMSTNLPVEVTDETLDSSTTEWTIFGSDEVLSEDSINQIMSGKAALTVWLFLEYGRDGKTIPYIYEYHGYFDHRIMSFVQCHNNNRAN